MDRVVGLEIGLMTTCPNRLNLENWWHASICFERVHPKKLISCTKIWRAIIDFQNGKLPLMKKFFPLFPNDLNPFCLLVKTKKVLDRDKYGRLEV
ncbi:MAG: hypothetical protein Ct9H300mP28_28530 [Pseudomonadota bacterium]|nr:MAG: hypothetical protein Ct9H300mP28_28530 [Pseudomonadota bacterium]